jgi:H+/Cl- antiporter ClcA
VATAAQRDPTPNMASKQFVALLVLAALVGVVASLAAWCFLELIHQIQVGVFTDLPKELGYDNAPEWWPLPVLALGGGLVAFAIVRLPGGGGHLPANGLSAGTTRPIELPGILLAGLATVGLGAVLGPEAPLIALGGGLGILAAHLVGKDAQPAVPTILAASATFAALSLIFQSPLIAAIILIEMTGLGGSKLPVVLVPGLMAAAIGSLVSIGMGSFTGLSSSDYAIGVLPVPDFARPDLVDFLWTVPFAVVVALGTLVVFRLARELVPVVTRRPFVLLPAAGLIVAGLAIAFSRATDKGADEVLFSGQDDVGGLVSGAGSWSLGALALLIAIKGLAYSVSLASFRGGPTFPAMYLGVAAGLMAAQLPGFSTTPAVAVGLGAAVVSVLRLPLSTVVLAVLLTSGSGPGASPVIIVGVIVAYLTTIAVSRPPTATAPREDGLVTAGARQSGQPIAARGAAGPD